MHDSLVPEGKVYMLQMPMTKVTEAKVEFMTDKTTSVALQLFGEHLEWIQSQNIDVTEGTLLETTLVVTYDKITKKVSTLKFSKKGLCRNIQRQKSVQ